MASKMRFDVEVNDGATPDIKKIERALNDVGDGAKKGFKTAGDASDKLGKSLNDVGDDAKRGFKRAENAADEFKDEAKSTSREAAASFTGDFEDVSDAIQETLANALSGFGPMGAAAGMAAAAGIGILVATLQQSQEKAEETRQRIQDLATEIYEAGGVLDDVDWAAKFDEFAQTITDAASWFEPWQMQSRTAIDDVAQAAEELGLTFSDLFKGMAGDKEAASRAIREINEEIAKAEAAGIEAGKQVRADEMEEQRQRIVALTEQREKLEEAAEATEEAQSRAELYAEAVSGSRDAIEKFNDAQQEKLDLLKSEAEMNMSAAEAAAAWAEHVAENRDRLTELNELIDNSSEATRAATDAVTDNGNALDLNTEAGRLAAKTMIDTAKAGLANVEAMREQGASAAELEAATQLARDEFIKTATQMGLNEDAASRLANEYGLIPSTVRTTAVFDKTAAQYDIDKFIRDNTGRLIKVRVGASGQVGYSYTDDGYTAFKDGGRVGIPAASDGMYVRGPGNGTSDDVLIQASNGEWVVRSRAVRDAGPANMAALNDGRPIRGRLEGGTPAGRVAGPALLSRADLDYLADRIGQAVTGARSPGNETLQLVVDGKVLAEAVRKHNRGLK